jgi:hypothetical protein
MMMIIIKIRGYYLTDDQIGGWITISGGETRQGLSYVPIPRISHRSTMEEDESAKQNLG